MNRPAHRLGVDVAFAATIALAPSVVHRARAASSCLIAATAFI
jgi:hypothetical protein